MQEIYIKKHNKKLRNLVIFVVLLIIASLAFLWYSNCNSVYGFSCGGLDTSSVDIDKDNTNILGETINNLESTEKALWWDADYKFARSLTIQNLSPISPLTQEEILTINFDHQELVNEGKSYADGKDLHLVYFSEITQEYTQVPFTITDLNTTGTKLSFQLLSDINLLETDGNYCLYYGNDFAVEIQTEEDIEAQTTSTGLLYTIKLNDEKRNPVQSYINRKWILLGTEDYSDLELNIEIIEDNIEVDSAEYEIVPPIGTEVDELSGEISQLTSNTYGVDIDTTDLPVGTYLLRSFITTPNGVELDSATHEFIVSHPLYVTWSMDWEGMDTSEATLKAMEDFSTEHDLPIIQLWNPRAHFVLSQNRLNRLLGWIKDRENKGDEIGLHMHMFTDMVAKAGVDPKNSPNWAADRNKSGSDTPQYVYSYEENIKMLEWAKSEFNKVGLKTPKIYRAGGWMADMNLIKALNDSGFVIDTSGRTPFSLGEYKVKIRNNETGEYSIRRATNDEISLYLTSLTDPNANTSILPEFVEHKVEGKWNLSSTTQPYQISENDINLSTLPSLNVWEFPNNGADSWRFNSQDLMKRFTDNFNGQPLREMQVLTYLTHPHSIQIDIKKLDPTFDHIDQFKASNDQGPVIYSTFQEPYTQLTGASY